jgi:hypothetical protein
MGLTMRKFNNQILFGMVIVTLLLGTIPVVAAQSTPSTQPYATARREVPIHIKIVFIGIDQNLIDKEYMTWNNPHYKYQSYLIPGISTNVVFAMNYDYVFANPQFENNFVNYLSSIAKVEKHTNVLWNLSYFGIDENIALNYTNFRITTQNTFYSADEVEHWLTDHSNEYGGFPSDGYTLIIADLFSRTPSVTTEQYKTLMKKQAVEATPHYYNKTFMDPDLGLVRNRGWMTSWGGNERLYYIDLSAGPSFVTTELPIQLAEDVNNIDIHTAYGKTWLNQYVSNYVYGAVYNLFTPDFVYPINYANEYRIKIVAIDNRTQQKNLPLEKTINADLIKNELQKLLSFSKVDVETKYIRAADNPELERLIIDSTMPSTNIPSIEPTEGVDASPVYDWLNEQGKGHISDFLNVTRNTNEYDIPVFVFAFDDNYQFAFTFKEQIGDCGEGDRTLWGVSLYDMVLIGHSTRDFNRGDVLINEPRQPGKGYGFSNTIIHEVGHMVGLNHPFIYDQTEDFVSSVMAYYPYDTSFSRFDIDVLQRGYADQLIIYASSTLSETASILVNYVNVNSATNYLQDAEDRYAQMDYSGAINSAYESAMQAAQAKMLSPNLFVTSGLLIGLGVGGIIGLAIGYYIWKRKSSISTYASTWTQPQTTTTQYPCSSCNKPLTWVSEYQRWYCQNCKKYV